LDAQVAWAFEKSQTGGRRGKWPYFKLGVSEYWRYRPGPLTLKHDGGETAVTPLVVAIANCKQYGSGAQIAPRAVVNDGLLHLAVVDNVPWYRLLPVLPKIFRGTFTEAPFHKTILTKTLTVDFGVERPYHMDGEVRSAPTLRADILPRALSLLTPPGYSVGPSLE
jgi:diacylglycerol kinase family enzyme